MEASTLINTSGVRSALKISKIRGLSGKQTQATSWHRNCER